MSKILKNDLNISESKYSDDCFLCGTINQFHGHHNMTKILKSIKKVIFVDVCCFICLVCNFDTKEFNYWKEHIMSTNHVSKCHEVAKLSTFVSYSCKACKTLFYGSKKFITQHQIYTKCKNNNLPSKSFLLTEKLKHMDTISNHLYFCTHCNVHSEIPCHTYDEKQFENMKVLYCECCRITFFCNTKVYDSHLLSVEHLTFKLIYLIKKDNSKLNSSEKNIKTHRTEIINDLTSGHTTLKLPVCIQNSFQNISQSKAKCKKCEMSIDWNYEKIFYHFCICKKKEIPLSNIHESLIKTFDCQSCKYITQSFTDYEIHVISQKHLKNSHQFGSFYSYFCTTCNLYMYSPKRLIAKHWNSHYPNSKFSGVPELSQILADNFVYMIKYPNCESIDFNGCPQSSHKNVNLDSLIKCHSCKINFRTSVDEYNLHKISSEHIILKNLTPKNLSLCKNNTLSLTHLQLETNLSPNPTLNSEVLNNFPKKNLTELQKVQAHEEKFGNHNKDTDSTSSLISSTNINQSKCQNTSNHVFVEDQVKKKRKKKKKKSKTDVHCTHSIEVDVINHEKFSINSSNLDLNKMAFDRLIHRETVINNDNIDIRTPKSIISFSNGVKLNEHLKSTNLDDAYGQYVTQRLKYIHNTTIKNEIKLEIDSLFDSIIFQQTKDTVKN